MPILAILWARRLIVLSAVVGCFLGGLTIMVISPPRYLATARVMMNYIKPDPVTGGYVNSKNADAYVISQIQLVTDFQVAVPAVEALGWLDNPEFMERYNSDAANLNSDFPVWVARSLLQATSARRVEDSNLLEIGFRAPEPQISQAVVEAIRESYVNASINRRNDSAAAQADVLAADAQEMRKEIAELEGKKNAYEREVGIALQEGHVDVDSNRLKSLIRETPRTYIPKVGGMSTAATDLMQLDAQLAQTEQTLGPNHPSLAQMRRQRELLRAQVKAEQVRGDATGQALEAQAAARSVFIEKQKEKVLSQREKVLQLRLYQDEIDRISKTLKETQTQVAQLRQLTTATESGLTPIGEARVRPRPVFPNPSLMLGGSTAIGLLLGGLLAVLIELMDRRVRTTRDLELATAIPMLGVVPRIAASPGAARWGLSGPRFAWPWRRRAVPA